jgi:hypothetical protein
MQEMKTIEHRRSVVRAALARRRQQLKSRKLCPDCGHNKPVEEKTLCQNCLDARKRRESARRARNHAPLTGAVAA